MSALNVVAIVMSLLAIIAAVWHGRVVRGYRLNPPPMPPTVDRVCPKCRARTRVWEYDGWGRLTIDHAGGPEGATDGSTSIPAPDAWMAP